MSVRIAGGAFAGRELSGPPVRRGRGLATEVGPRGVRPSGVRLRKSLFAVLADETAGARVLDVCAGVGTLGFEAVSRGARECLFVERSPRLARIVERNAARLGVTCVRIVVGDAVRELRRLASAGDGFDIALLDPPWEAWESDLGGRLLAGAAALAPLVVAEHRAARPPPPVAELGGGVPARGAGSVARTRTVVVGDGAFSLYRPEG